MTQSLLSSLHTSVLPGHEIGQVALRLTQAIDQAVPVAPTAIIPRSTLQEIADFNQLPDKVARTSSHLQVDDQHQVEAALSSIKQAIRHQHIPEHLRNWGDVKEGCPCLDEGNDLTAMSSSVRST